MQAVIGAVLLLSAAMSGGNREASELPVRLHSQIVDDRVRLTVIGASEKPVGVSYSLKVTSGAAPGSNRSVQRGTARLSPGAEATLITLILGNAREGWSALLQVVPEDGRPYEQSAGASGASGH